MSVSEGIKKYFNKNYYVKIIGEDKDVQKVKIQPWTMVYELKLKISQKYFINYKNIRLFYCNIEMIDNNNMLDYKIIDAKNPEIYFKFCDVSERAISIQVYGTFKCCPILDDLINKVKLGFLEGLVPTLIPDGTSGTYKLRDAKKETIALFKPIDEEAFAPNNQKGYTGKFGQEGFRKGILSGEGNIREVVAFLLDKKNFFRVPETTFVEISHPTFNKNENGLLLIEENSIPKIRNSIIHNFVIENLISDPIQFTETDIKFKKRHISINQLKKNDEMNLSEKSDNSKTHYTDNISVNNKINDFDTNSSHFVRKNIVKKYGSFQKFIISDDVAANYSNSLFSNNEIHKIGILDIRILNCDRNDENILIKKRKNKSTGKTYYKLIPIDHSLSLPDCIKISEYEMCWMGWDQAKEPFSDELKHYIRKINIIEDMNRLSKAVKMREKCWRNFRIANLVLKIANEFNLTLFDIGSILYRPGFEEIPSDIEKLINQANKTYVMYKTIFEDNISSDSLSYNIKNGKLLTSGGYKLLDNNKKLRKTSIDVYPNHKKSESNTPKKESDSKCSKHEIDKIKKNLILDFVDFQESKDDGEKNVNNFEIDEYLSLGAKSSNYKNNPYKDSEDQTSLKIKDKCLLNDINKQKSALLINADKDLSEYNTQYNVKKKKKTSLLRRTTSVPKLIGCTDIKSKEDSTGLKNRIINLEYKKDKIAQNSEINKDLKSIDLKIISKTNAQKSDHKRISHTEGENKSICKNDLESEVEDESEIEILTELNSPYNELFFYIFENLLEEYMKSKFK